jgi:hypothetical protein
MYTLIDLEKDVESIISELAEVRAQKGHDYSGEIDTLDNLRDYGWKGVEVRLGDKQKRLMHFVKSGGDLRVLDESIEDTMQDRINYSIFSLILYRQEKNQTKAVQPCPKKGFALGRHVIEQDLPVSERVNRQHEVDLKNPINRDIQTKIERAAATGGSVIEIPKSKIVDWESDIPGGEV